MASLMKKLGALIEGSLHELVDQAMRQKSLAVIDVYIRDAGEGLTELNDAIGTLEANLTGFLRERARHHGQGNNGCEGESSDTHDGNS